MRQKTPGIDPNTDATDVEPPSRSARKRASEALQTLGEALVELPDSKLRALPLPESLYDAIVDARRLPTFGAQRRQAQLIGKLMRRLDEDAVEAAREAVNAFKGVSARETALLHHAEQWRTDLLADDARIAQWLDAHPDTDGQRLRALIRQARKDARDAPADAPVRHGRAYRELYRLIRAGLAAKP